MMAITIWILLVCYAILLIIMAFGWSRLKGIAESPDVVKERVTIIIPVRNEAKNIIKLLKDLEAQDYPQEAFEVIVIDDHSTDQTLELTKAFAEESELKLTITQLQLANDFSGSHKKAAITRGIDLSNGQLILCTDGDCRVGGQWIRSMATFFKQKKAVFIAGPVFFSVGTGFWERLQQLEFASLIATGAAFMALGKPNMCNGANMAFDKSVFIQIGGYEGFSHIHSGDDEFLLAKMSKKYPDKVFFIKDRKAIVSTLPKESFKDFVNQRKRWAGKWKHHKQITPKLLALFIFITNFMLLIAAVAVLINGYSYQELLGQFFIKFLCDYLFMTIVLRFFTKFTNPFYVLILEIVYPLYAVFFGLFSSTGGYDWKGRALKN